MKKSVLLSSLLAVAVLLSSCGDKKKSNNNPTGPGGNTPVTMGTLKATVSGAVSLNFNSLTAVGHTSNTDTEKEMIVSGEAIANGMTYSIYIWVSTYGTGTFALDSDSDHTAQLTVIRSQTDADTYVNVTGSVNFTQVGTTLKGSFQFTAEKYDGTQVNVASGTFEVPVY
ncbi:hypothetical protein JW906_02550 [bacterium]|nr:hypothetical protein [bacterium]